MEKVIKVKPTKKLATNEQRLVLKSGISIEPMETGVISLPDNPQVRRAVDHYVEEGILTKVTAKPKVEKPKKEKGEGKTTKDDSSKK